MLLNKPKEVLTIKLMKTKWLISENKKKHGKRNMESLKEKGKANNQKRSLKQRKKKEHQTENLSARKNLKKNLNKIS